MMFFMKESFKQYQNIMSTLCEIEKNPNSLHLPGTTDIMAAATKPAPSSYFRKQNIFLSFD